MKQKQIQAERLFDAFVKAKATSLSDDSIYQAELAFSHLRDVHPHINSLDSVTPDHIHDLVLHLREKNVKDPTIGKYLSHLRMLYSFHQRRGNIESNPIAIAIDEINLDSSSNDRRHIPFEEMKQFVQGIKNPKEKCIILLLLKTGIRNGECCNLDLRDIHLNDDEYTKAYNVSPRQEIQSRPNTLYIDNDVSTGDLIDGEIRDAGNKRKIQTIIPIDNELKYTLKRYLAVRPNTSHLAADPLFVSTHGTTSRYTKSALGRLVARLAEENNWYDAGESLSSNVTPHYFRHYFSSHNRDAFGEPVLKYIRGDVGGDIVDHYTHAWALQIQEIYLKNIYKFDIF